MQTWNFLTVVYLCSTDYGDVVELEVHLSCIVFFVGKNEAAGLCR
jgi:hypothetical protein